MSAHVADFSSGGGKSGRPGKKLTPFSTDRTDRSYLLHKLAKGHSLHGVGVLNL